MNTANQTANHTTSHTGSHTGSHTNHPASGEKSSSAMRGNADAMAESGHAAAEKASSASRDNADAIARSSHAAADKVSGATKRNTDTLAQSSHAAISGLEELARAYQSMASRNVERLTASIKALAAVKTPVEFLELQQRLIKEGGDAVVNDSSHIAKLTAAVFTAAFDPVRKRVETLESNVKH